MFSTKIRTTIATLAATLVVGVVPATAQTSLSGTPHPVGDGPHPVVTAKNYHPVKDAGSAGIAGYTDDVCHKLAEDFKEVSNTASYVADPKQQGRLCDLAEHLYDLVTDNCMVVTS